MVARTSRFGRLVFDRDAIVRAALRAYVEVSLAHVDPLERHSFTACAFPGWTGDLQRGAFYNGNGCGDYDVVAWTETGVVGLAYELGAGPIEQLGLSVDAVTGGPDDVRGAVPELPAELEPAFEMAVGMLGVGPEHGQRDAGVGFWLYGDRVASTLFDDPTACGADRLAVWGLLRGGRLQRRYGRETAAFAAEVARTTAAPIHALADALVDRRLGGPTELTTDELATLLPRPPDPERLLCAQQRLRKVGITWPGSPEIPAEPT
ncbi:hypothetical protein [Polyangium sorediatum]|uniref:Uncharacterized protein n=1 Tax=Polyangium sorediatum TaxID=889274 RepID=A0ABT6NTF4_9BACT|nr:hypothetical protein [Polyangium sorediatum]MDI1431420.1 hypothetical protein [Polyangium sorediatum]